jgi:hypothetical protein
MKNKIQIRFKIYQINRSLNKLKEKNQNFKEKSGTSSSVLDEKIKILNREKEVLKWVLNER